MSQPNGPRAQVDVESALRLAARSASRSSLAWLLAGIAVCLVVFALDSDVDAVFTVIFVAVAVVLFLGSSIRSLVAARIGLRDFLAAATPPRRGYVVLLHDNNPRTVRPLLAIWAKPPRSGTQLLRPDDVYRADDELEDLASYLRAVVVHEAWVDTGPRESSKPRWVVADAGISLPHRKALFGRWYFSMLTRRSALAVVPLSMDPPHPGLRLGDGETPLGGSLLRSVAWRVLGLGVVALIVSWPF